MIADESRSICTTSSGTSPQCKRYSTGRSSGFGALWDCVPLVLSSRGGCAGGVLTRRRTVGRSQVSLYKILFHNEALSWESTILSSRGGCAGGVLTRRRTVGRSQVSLYKILFHNEALPWESTILLLTPPHLQPIPYCNTIAQPLRKTRLLTDPSFECHTPYTFGDGNVVYRPNSHGVRRERASGGPKANPSADMRVKGSSQARKRAPEQHRRGAQHRRAGSPQGAHG